MREEFVEAKSHSARNLIATVVAFAVVMLALAQVAGAGLAVFASIVLAGFIVPLVIVGAIHRDEIQVGQTLKKHH